MIEDVGYGRELRADVRGFVDVRLRTLRTGSAGRFFEGGHPADIAELMRRNVVLAIEDVANDEDKAFLIGTLIIRLVEHLRLRARSGPAAGLGHVIVIEEAHRLLRASRDGASAHAVELFASLLAEIRAYGEGIVVVEQIPAKLVPDVVKNTALKVVHRLPAHDDRQVVGAAMNLDDDQSRQVVSLRPGRGRRVRGRDGPAAADPGPVRGRPGAARARGRGRAGRRRWRTDPGPRQALGGLRPGLRVRPRLQPARAARGRPARRFGRGRLGADLDRGADARVPHQPAAARGARRRCARAGPGWSHGCASACWPRPWTGRCRAGPWSCGRATTRPGWPPAVGHHRAQAPGRGVGRGRPARSRLGDPAAAVAARGRARLPAGRRPAGPVRARRPGSTIPLDGLADRADVRVGQRVSGLRRHPLSMELARNRQPAWTVLLGEDEQRGFVDDLAAVVIGVSHRGQLRQAAGEMGIAGWLESVLSWPRRFIVGSDDQVAASAPSAASAVHIASAAMGKLPLRARLATTIGGAAGRVSRLSGRGDGSVIGGVLGLRMEPDLLRILAADRQIVLVTGTNGKTTTTRLITAALESLGQSVASNAFGANMEAGLASALGRAPNAPFGVLEVDERYLPAVMEATSPRVVTLLNLSRDQMDRAAEIWLVARRWREALAVAPGCHVIANADDPLVAWAAGAADRVTWVAAGQRWHEDSWCCPQCGSHLRRDDLGWRCGECGFARPATKWVLDGESVIDSTGQVRELQLALPGRANRANAVVALAVGDFFGADAGPGPAPAARGDLGGRPVHPAGAARPGAAAAAGQEPGRLAGGVRRADPGPGAGAAGRQRAGARRPGHLLAVGRGLPGAARPPGAHLRRAQARPRGQAGGGRGAVRPGRRRGRRGGPGAARHAGRDRQLHGVPADQDGPGPGPVSGWPGHRRLGCPQEGAVSPRANTEGRPMTRPRHGAPGPEQADRPGPARPGRRRRSEPPAAGVGLPGPAEHLRRPRQPARAGAPGQAARDRGRGHRGATPTSRCPARATST